MECVGPEVSLHVDSVCICLLVRGNVGAHFTTKERSC